MVPASVYLGFTASIIWVGQVVSCRLLSLILLYSEMEPIVSHAVREHILHQLLLAMQKTATCMKEL